MTHRRLAVRTRGAARTRQHVEVDFLLDGRLGPVGGHQERGDLSLRVDVRVVQSEAAGEATWEICGAAHVRRALK